MSYDQMTPEQLLEAYNSQEKTLFDMGHGYQNIPEGEFSKIEYWLRQAGYGLEKPKQGLSSLKKLGE